MDPSPIMFLPVELIIRILTYLPFKDIVLCSGLSRHFNELVESSTILQYIIELGLSGLVDSGGGPLSTAKRLVLLRELEDAWSTLNWRHTTKIPIGRRFIFWELCGGTFAGSYRSKPDYPYGHHTFDMIDFFDLGSRKAIAPEKTIDLGGRFCNFSVDPGQDLLVLVEEPPHMPKVWIMQIRRISDALPHPNATHHILEVPVAHETWSIQSQSHGPGTVETQILGTVILFCQRRGPGLSGSLSVFDWVAGKMTLMIYPQLGDWHGTLTSEQHLLLSQRPGYRNQPRLELYDVRPRSKWSSPKITYLLPFGDNEKWRTKACYGPASFTCTTEYSAGASRPFVPSCPPLLLAFRFIHPQATQDPGDFAESNSSLDMFLIPSKLQKYGKASDVVKWEEWGPQSTRWFRSVLPNKWRRNIQGYRAVLPEKNTVLDFNPHVDVEDQDALVTQPSHVPSDSPAGRGIVSSLPYRTRQPREPFGSQHILLDDQIVCVETNPQELGVVKAFRVLSF